MHDQIYDGRKFRILTVIDAFTRYVPAIALRETLTGADVVAAFEEFAGRSAIRSRSASIKGPNLSKDLDMWAYARGVKL